MSEEIPKKKKKKSTGSGSSIRNTSSPSLFKKKRASAILSGSKVSEALREFDSQRPARSPSRLKNSTPNLPSLPPLSPELSKKLFTGKSVLIANLRFEILRVHSTNSTNNTLQDALVFAWKRGSKSKNRGCVSVNPTALEPFSVEIAATFMEQAPPKKSADFTPHFQPKLMAFSLSPAVAKKSPKATFKSSQTTVIDLAEWIVHPGASSQQLVFPTGLVISLKLTVDWLRLNGKKVVPLVNASEGTTSAASAELDFGLVTDNEHLSDDDVTDLDGSADFSGEDDDDDDHVAVDNDDRSHADAEPSAANAKTKQPPIIANSDQTSLAEPKKARGSSLKSPSLSALPSSSISRASSPLTRSPSKAAALSEDVAKKLFTGKSILATQFTLLLRSLKSTQATDHSMSQEYTLSWKRGAKSKNRGACTFHPQSMDIAPITFSATFSEQSPPKNLKKSGNFTPRFQSKCIDLSIAPATKRSSSKPSFKSSQTSTVDLSEWVIPNGTTLHQVIFPCGLCADIQAEVQWTRLNGKKVVALTPNQHENNAAPLSDHDFGLVTDTENLSDGDDDITDLDSTGDCFQDDDVDATDDQPPSQAPTDATPTRSSFPASSGLDAAPRPLMLRGQLGSMSLMAELSLKLNTPLRDAACEAPPNPTQPAPTLDSSPLRARALCGGPAGRRPPSRSRSLPGAPCISSKPPLTVQPSPAPPRPARSPAPSRTATSSPPAPANASPLVASELPPQKSAASHDPIPASNSNPIPASNSNPIPASIGHPIPASVTGVSSEGAKKLFTGKSTLIADISLQCTVLRAAKSGSTLEPSYLLSWKRGSKSKNKGTCTITDPAAIGMSAFNLTASFQEQPPPKKAAQFTPRFQPKPLVFSLTPVTAKKPSKPSTQTVTVDLADWVVHPGHTQYPVTFPNGLELQVSIVIKWVRLNGKLVVPVAADRTSQSNDDFGLLTDNENLSDDASDLDSASDFAAEDEQSLADPPVVAILPTNAASDNGTPSGRVAAPSNAAEGGRAKRTKKKTKKKSSRKSLQQTQSQSILGASSGLMPYPSSSSSTDASDENESPALRMLAELKPPPPPNLEKLLCRDCGSSIDFDQCVAHLNDCQRLRAESQQRLQQQAAEYLKIVSEPPSEGKDLRLVSFVLALDPAERLRVLDFPDPSIHRTPLMTSVIKGDLSSVRILLHCGVGLTHRDATLEKKSALDLSASTGHHEILKELLRAGAPLPLMGGHAHHTGQRATPLHYAVRTRSYECVIALLQHRIDPSYPDQLGKTPLHLAIEMKNPKMVATLVRYGASPTRPGGMKLTPMQLAHKLGYRQCVEAMEKANPDQMPEMEILEDATKNLRNGMSLSDTTLSLHSNSDEHSSSEGTDAALDSSSEGEVDQQQLEAAYLEDQRRVAIQTAYQSRPATPSQTSTATPAIKSPASKEGKKSLSSTLDSIIGLDPEDLKFEAEMRIQNRLPQCPIKPKGFSNLFHRFVLAGDWEALRNFEGRTEQLDQGVTPLFLCAYASSFQKECAAELVSMGANVNFVHVDSGWTPLHAAAHNNQAGVVEILITNGANTAARTAEETPMTEKIGSFIANNAAELLSLDTKPPPPKKYEDYSALDLAIGYKSTDAIRMLKRYKAPAFKYLYAYRVQNK